MFEHILIPLDGSQLAECVLAHSLAIARAFQSRITLLQVVERTGAERDSRLVDPLTWHIRKTEANSYLEGVATRLREAGAEVDYTIREGQAPEEIIEFAHNSRVNLICLSSHGQSGLSGWNINSVVQKVVLRAYVPMLIARAYQHPPVDLTGLHYRRLLLPLDGSLRAESIIQYAVALAETHESQVLLTHVSLKPILVRRSPPPPEDIELVNQLTERNRQEATRYLRQIQSQLRLDTSVQVHISENIAGTLHDLVKSEQIDLVMLCAHGQSGDVRWPYGNVALSFIAFGTAPLLIIQDVSQNDAEHTEAEIASREHKGH